jgi:hypothetical protein
MRVAKRPCGHGGAPRLGWLVSSRSRDAGNGGRPQRFARRWDQWKVALPARRCRGHTNADVPVFFQNICPSLGSAGLSAGSFRAGAFGGPASASRQRLAPDDPLRPRLAQFPLEVSSHLDR